MKEQLCLRYETVEGLVQHKYELELVMRIEGIV